MLVFHNQASLTPAEMGQLDEHIVGMEKLLEQPAWWHGDLFRGLVFDTNDVPGWYLCGLAVVERPESKIGYIQRHELAHVAIDRYCDAAARPPTLLIEGWAETQSGHPPGFLAAKRALGSGAAACVWLSLAAMTGCCMAVTATACTATISAGHSSTTSSACMEPWSSSNSTGPAGRKRSLPTSRGAPGDAGRAGRAVLGRRGPAGHRPSPVNWPSGLRVRRSPRGSIEKSGGSLLFHLWRSWIGRRSKRSRCTRESRFPIICEGRADYRVWGDDTRRRPTPLSQAVRDRRRTRTGDSQDIVRADEVRRWKLVAGRVGQRPTPTGGTIGITSAGSAETTTNADAN